MSEFDIGERVAKYRRVLPCLRTEQSVLRRSAQVMLQARGVPEPCDVVLRLQDGLGRIHAELAHTLEPGDETLNLGPVLNLPAGRYHLVIAPPDVQFYAGVQERRTIALTIACEPWAARGADSAELRAQVLLDRFAGGGGVETAMARLSRGKPRLSDDGTLAEAVSRDTAVAFAAISLPPHAAPTAFTAAMERMVWAASGDDWAAGAARSLLSGSADGARDWLCDATLGPVPETPTRRVAAIVALAGLAPDMAELCLDRVALALALRSAAGAVAASDDGPADSRIGPLPALTRLLWGTGTMDGADTGVMALAHSGYATPELLQAVALSPGPRRTHEPLPDGGFLLTQTDADLAAAIGPRNWQLRVGADIVACGGLGDGTAPELGFHAFEQCDISGNAVIARAGRYRLALAAKDPIDLLPHPSGAGQALAASAGWSLAVAAAGDDPSLAAPGTLRLPDGTVLRIDAPPAPVAASVTPGLRLDPSRRQVEMRFGDYAMILDAQ